MLVDSYNRKLDYLRISVTDRCNLRCSYCIPKDGIITKPKEELLTFEEILRLAKIFVCLGIKKIRLTGGEPLIRKEIIDLIKSLANIEGIEEISLTTNGILLGFYAEELKKAGVKRINVSLDTLKEDKFKVITGNNSLYEVLEGIDKAREVGFSHLKLNMVVMKGINDDEIIDFVEFSLKNGLILRFIEFMKVTPLWREDYFISIEEIKKICERRFKLRRIENLGPGPAIYYRIQKGGILGFINTDENNCRICGRLRLTSAGELKNCLYETEGLLLREFLRNGYDDEKVKDIIKTKVVVKQDANFYNTIESPQFYMCDIGG